MGNARADLMTELKTKVPMTIQLTEEQREMLSDTIENVEKKMVKLALETYPSKFKASQALGISHHTLYNKIYQYGFTEHVNSKK